eukprot:SAG31_NODE_146_length_22601_cov_56.529192_20_plen_123_part_00
MEPSTVLASCGAGLVGSAVFDVRSLAAPSLWVTSCPGWVPLRAQEATVQSWRAFDGNQSLWALHRHAADRSVCSDDFVRLCRAQRLWLVVGDLVLGRASSLSMMDRWLFQRWPDQPVLCALP